MKPQAHVATSAGLGAIFWAKSRDPWTMVLSLVFGVLVDLDHLIDYWHSEGCITFDAKTFMATRYWRKSGRIFLFFHAFEYLPLLFVFWRAWKGRRWAVAATVAMSSHVLADHLVNELRPLGYFISYRLAHRFQASEIIDMPKTRRMEAARLERNQRGEQGNLSLPRRLAGFFV